MDQGGINLIAFCSCLLGLGVGWWLIRYARRELALMAGERQRLLKRRVGLLGRRVHARAILAAGVVVLYLSATGMLTLFLRR
jgi:hypothetical protein